MLWSGSALRIQDPIMSFNITLLDQQKGNVSITTVMSLDTMLLHLQPRDTSQVPKHKTWLNGAHMQVSFIKLIGLLKLWSEMFSRFIVSYFPRTFVWLWHSGALAGHCCLKLYYGFVCQAVLFSSFVFFCFRLNVLLMYLSDIQYSHALFSLNPTVSLTGAVCW